MKLKEVDWNASGGAADIEVEYPDAPLAEFLNWLRRTSAWQETPGLVERRVRRLNMILMDHRNAAGTKPTAPKAPAPDAPLLGAGKTMSPQRLAALAKGRATLAARRAAAKAQVVSA